MGCTITKERDEGYSVSSQRSGNSQEFITLSKQNPVAAKLLEEWNKFVKVVSTGSAKTKKEVWADTTKTLPTHRSVDTVGKSFLAYVKSDLASRGWGGNFDYSVVGGSSQGHIKANATVTAKNSSGSSRKGTWEVKVHYKSSG